uniref:Putative secreted protein n=1 Tax=Ixodes ricinus TaxID=34613 RepID=A0A6B0U2R4_IXORI
MASSAAAAVLLRSVSTDSSVVIRTAKYSVSEAWPPLIRITSVEAAYRAIISWCNADLWSQWERNRAIATVEALVHPDSAVKPPSLATV